MIIMMSDELLSFPWSEICQTVIPFDVLNSFVPGDGEGEGDGSEGDDDGDGDEDSAPATKGEVRALVVESVKSALGELKIGDLVKQVGDLSKKIETSGPKGTQRGNSGKGGKGSEGKGTEGEKAPLSPEVNDQLIEMRDKIESLELQLTETKEAKEVADKKLAEESLNGRIRAEIDRHEYITDTAKATAFSLVKPLIREGEDGKLIAGEKLAPRQARSFIKDFFEKEHPYLLKNGNSGGAGVGAGGSGGTGVSVTTEQITPGMTKETRLAAVTSIQKAING